MEAQQQVSRSTLRDISPRYLRPTEWMRATGMTVGPTYRALYAGKLKGVQIGRSWFIPVSELDEFFTREAA